MEKLNLVLMIFTVFSIPMLRSLFFAESSSNFKRPAQKRKKIFDLAKGLAIMAVVLIHVSWIFLINNELGIQEKMLAFFLNNVSRFAIAIFFISSGVLLRPLKNGGEYFSFLKKKFFKIFIPYTLVTLILGLISHGSVKEISYNIATGKGSLPFYFVVVLFQFYIIYPVVEKFISRQLLFFSFFVSLGSFFLPFTWGAFGFIFFFKYFFFFVYGVYYRNRFLDDANLKKEGKLWLFLLLFFVALSLLLPGFYFNIRLIFGVAVFNFLFVYRKFLLEINFSKIFTFMGERSLWIFLLHYSILEALYPYIDALIENFYFSYALLFASVLLLSVLSSCLISFVFKKINIKSV